MIPNACHQGAGASPAPAPSDFSMGSSVSASSVNGSVSPLFVARLSALSMTHLELLTSSELRDGVADLVLASSNVRESAASANDALFRIVPRATDSSVRASLLRLRRDLFNERLPRPDDLARAFEFSWPDERTAIAPMVTALERYSANLDRLVAAHETVLAESRKSLATLLDDERLGGGVLMASPSLYASFARYKRGVTESFRAREAQIERGLLRYLTRAAAKATPFASFCKIVEGRVEAYDGISEGSDAPVLYSTIGTLDDGPHVVRINKQLFDLIWSTLRVRPAVRPHLIVELNPTLRVVDGSLTFLAVLDDAEVLQRIDQNEELAFVVDEVRKHGPASPAQLAQVLAAIPSIETTSEDVESFLLALVDVGLLRPRSPVHSQDTEWVGPLRSAIAHIDDAFVRTTTRFLDQVNTAVQEYATAPLQQRASLDRCLRSSLDELLVCAGHPAGSFADPLLFEDCGAALQLTIPQTKENTRCFEVLTEWVRRTHSLSYPRSEMAGLRAFFDGNFPDRVGGVPLLELYENYYREHRNEHLTRIDRMRSNAKDPSLDGYDTKNPFGVPIVAQIRETIQNWSSLIRARWTANPDAEEIDIPLADFPSIGKTMMSDTPIPRSVSLFCQLAHDGRGTRILVPDGRLAQGFGKYFSRFLSVLPEEFTDAVRNENADLGGDALVELAGDGNHNANFHPPLLRREMAYPTGDTSLPHNIVRWDDIVVRRDLSDEHSLVLICASTGERVYPVDLGFLSQVRRPALFQFLLNFSVAGPISIPLPTSPNGIESIDNAGIIYRPRISMGGHIVVARRSWTVPAAHFPERGSDESASDYFVRINEWRTALRIPARVYVRVFPLERGIPKDTSKTDSDAQPAPSTAAQRASRDYKKPQFIDFESPILTALFARIHGTLTDYVVRIEEQYPTTDQLPHVNGQPHAVELVMQVNWKEGGSASS